jgi:hypothetical protein
MNRLRPTSAADERSIAAKNGHADVIDATINRVLEAAPETSGEDCPDPTALAAWYDAPRKQSHPLDGHLSDCALSSDRRRDRASRRCRGADGTKTALAGLDAARAGRNWLGHRRRERPSSISKCWVDARNRGDPRESVSEPRQLFQRRRAGTATPHHGRA